MLLALLGCSGEPGCEGPRDPATTTYEWVKIGRGAVCAGSADGCVDCWGGADERSMLDEPYEAFDLHYGLACGVTTTGEPRCWSWEGRPDPVDTEPLIPERGTFDGVEVTENTACWTHHGQTPVCPVTECDAATDPANPECTDQAESEGLVSFVGAMREYCGLAPDGETVCWGFLPGLAITRPGPYVWLDAANSICGLEAEGSAWCSSLGSESTNSAEVREFAGDYVQVAAGYRVLLLDDLGYLTDEHYRSEGGTAEYGYLCEIDPGPYTTVASYYQLACALPVGGGIACWYENDAGCITGTPTDLPSWY